MSLGSHVAFSGHGLKQRNHHNEGDTGGHSRDERNSRSQKGRFIGLLACWEHLRLSLYRLLNYRQTRNHKPLIPANAGTQIIRRRPMR